MNSLPSLHKDGPTWAQAVIFAASGLALLFVAAYVRRRPPKHKDTVLVKLVDADPAFIFGVGAMRLAVNASTLALYIPALHVIASSQVNVAIKAVAFLALFVITEAAVLGPVIAVTLAGERAKPVLTKVHDTMEKYSKPATVVACAGFGLVLLGLSAWTVWQVA